MPPADSTGTQEADACPGEAELARGCRAKGRLRGVRPGSGRRAAPSVEEPMKSGVAGLEREAASPWRRGQSVASLRLALQLRQEQLGGGRLLPTAETRKVPLPLNKHTRVLGHREMLGETGMPSVRCGGGRGGHRTGRCGAQSRLQASERVGSRHLQGQRGGAPEKSAICLRD